VRRRRMLLILVLTDAVASCQGAQTTSGVLPALRPCVVGQGSGATAGECGVLTVPENRATRRGRTIDIHYAVLRGDRQPAHEALVMFAGGPGESSLVAMGNVGWNGPVRASMDTLLVEQRGTGQSHPLDCDSSVSSTPAASFGHVFDPAWVRRCRDTLGADADLTQYTTESTVQDIEDVRASVGYEKLSVYGASYGTRVAQAYMRRYPNRIKAVVIDGTVPFDNAIPLTYAASAQQALDRVFAACVANPSCQAAYPNLPGAFQALLHQFDRGLVSTTVAQPSGGLVPVRMSRGDFGYAVRGLLYREEAVGMLPEMIGRAASTGDLREFAQAYWERHLGFSQDFAYGLHWSVLCAEDVAFVTEASVETATAKTFLGRYVIDEYLQACAHWPRAEITSDFRKPADVDVPTLLISSYFDPVTPPQFAERIARSLPLARLIVAPTASHGSVSGCPRAAALHLLITGTFDRMPQVCR
jgi:pimeloyl-ACP methyl ester carboxylesterase